MYSFDLELLRKIIKREKDKQWRRENPDKIKAYRKSVRDRSTKRCKEYRKTPKGREITLKGYRKRDKRQIDNLTDSYVIRVIKRHNDISTDQIKKFPEFIKSYRQQIKLKRLIKQKENESIKEKQS